MCLIPYRLREMCFVLLPAMEYFLLNCIFFCILETKYLKLKYKLNVTAENL